MTQQVKQRLEKELRELDTELRVKLPKEIKKALEFGDLRENAEYRAALDRQEFVRARIGQLRKRLEDLSSVDLSRLPRDKASYGSTLLLFEAGQAREVTYRLVSPEESDPENGLISTTSPIGKSLMGKGVGDEVVVQTPGGERHYEVRSLTTVHDDLPEPPPTGGK